MTTLPEDWSEGMAYGYGAVDPNEAEATYPAVVPVKVVYTENENLPPGFASMMTWPITQVGQGVPTQILQRREHRFKCQLMVSIPGAGSITFNTKQEPLSKDANPQGFTLTFTAANNNPGLFLPPFEASQPLYAIASIAGVIVATMDQSFGQVQ